MTDPAEIRPLVRRLKKANPRKVDGWFHMAHDEVFACTDCLQCANCCRTTGPRFTPKDIERLARHMRMTQHAFEVRFLRVDEDGDHVLQSVPCPFLGADNMCAVYDVRPKACREYPHTDREKQVQILGLAEKNAVICPAVAQILDKVRQRLERDR